MKDPAKKNQGRREKHAEADRELDGALEDSFPAIDPLPTTGTFAGAPEDREAEKRRSPTGGKAK